MYRMVKVSLAVLVCVLVGTTLSAFVQQFGSVDLPLWMLQAQSTALLLALAFIAFSSACSLALDLSKTDSSAYKTQSDVTMVDLLNNKLAVSFIYSACWIPILLFLASIQVNGMLEDYDTLPSAAEIIIRYHCGFLRHIPDTVVQTLALSALVSPRCQVGSTSSAIPVVDSCRRVMMKMALLLPIASRLILHIFALPETTRFRHIYVRQTLPICTSLLFCDVEIDSEYLEVARYEMFVTMLLCLIYSALHLPQYLERVLPHLTQQMHENAKSEKGTRTEHHKTTDVVGLLALYWTIAATPLLLIHVQATGHEEWTSCLTIPSHILLLFAIFLLLNGDDPIYAEVMKVRGREEEEEDDATPLWLLDEKQEEEVEREKGGTENDGANDVHPLWFNKQEI
ncbi:uncharacterized protein LOC119598305 isoform X2 [Penaeus monodon]|uniref:uncharacterized protein LOC119598305 isoform X2 n=1 Tax=Penaeus monodon TaxID=6687 RepID=UPI0018A74FC2|nr:uncharacterized protein LOC119598305 isoform X2 [Penaeus monodon]